MTKLTLSLAMASLLASQLHAQDSIATATKTATSTSTPTPMLEGTVGIGAGIGMQRYDGTFGHQTSVYGRGILSYHPVEWLGTRLIGGYGNLTNNDDKHPAYETDWFSNLGVGLVLQPYIGLGGFRPYLASGISTTFGTSIVDGNPNHDLDWNPYVPVELGIDFLIADNLSVGAWMESYAYMKDWERLDGVRSPGKYYYRRDELQKFGFGFTFLIGGKSDADGDGIADAQDQCPGTPKGIAVDAKGCPFDGDNDGVPNYKDKCPNTPQGTVVDSFGCALDSDKDGVNDYYDKCPGTAFGVKVDAVGCPLPAVIADADHDGISDSLDRCPGTPAGTVVDATGCPLDSDKDGVPDNIDKCPNTPLGVKVDATGCTLPVVVADADHDGIPDSLDKCPGTRPGTIVDSNGCPAIVLVKGAKLVMEGIVFKTNSAVIDEVSAPVLARAAVAISKAPGANIVIAGYTDNVGKAAYNQKLSERRAASVKAYLVKSGVPKAQLSSKGFGEKDPIVDNSSVVNRSENRRIEFHVL
jgi:outer membrane protein OmpA-like peptidoglycan-associated protein